jgi:hypothetical protein
MRTNLKLKPVGLYAGVLWTSDGGQLWHAAKGLRVFMTTSISCLAGGACWATG